MPFVKKIAKPTLGQKLTSKTSESWMWAQGSRFSLTKLMLAGITKGARRRSYARRFMFTLTKLGASRCTSKRRRREFGVQEIPPRPCREMHAVAGVFGRD